MTDKMPPKYESGGSNLPPNEPRSEPEGLKAGAVQNSGSISNQDSGFSTNLIQKYSSDIDRMLQHCRDKGIPIPAELATDVATLYQEEAGEKVKAPPEIELLLKVHGKLCGLIAPATPRSLAVTDLTNFKESWPFLLLMFILILSAFGGVIGYIITLGAMSPNAITTPAANPAGASLHGIIALASLTLKSAATNIITLAKPFSAPSAQFNTQLNYLFAAMMGAAFSGLLTAYDYIKNRSFDPNYNVAYIIRFVIGVLAGVVLSNLGTNLFTGSETLSKLGPGIIALLGGYSAEAVRQILDRLVEVLVTTVKGAETGDNDRIDIAKEVLSIATDSGIPDEVKLKLDGLVKKLQK